MTEHSDRGPVGGTTEATPQSTTPDDTTAKDQLTVLPASTLFHRRRTFRPGANPEQRLTRAINEVMAEPEEPLAAKELRLLMARQAQEERLGD
jgi:hypothetical protein